MVPFAEYRPDLDPWNPAYSDNILNVRPTATGYSPFKGLADYSNALAGECRGYFTARATDGTITLFAATADELYKFNSSTLNWDDVGNASTYTGVGSGGFWDFAQFGDYVIAVNGVDSNQVWQLGSSSAFADLGGSPPIAKRVTVVGDFVVLYNLASNERGMHWSAINDHTGWTVGQNKSDTQTFPDGGALQYVGQSAGGATVIQRHRIRPMIFDPASPYIFRFPQNAESRGAVSPLSVTQVGNSFFYLDEDGFYQWNGQQALPIGAERVDRTFLGEALLDGTNVNWVQAAADPANKQILWRYKSSVTQGTESQTNSALCYDWQLQRWTRVNIDLTWLSTAATAGYSLDDIDSLGYTIDTFPGSLDDSWLDGGRITLAGFGTAHKLGFLTGQTLAATLETADMQLAPDRRSLARYFRPIVDTSSATGQVGTKATHSDTPRSWSNITAQSADGRIYCRKDGLLHRFRVNIGSGVSWTHATGVSDIDSTPTGYR